MRSILILCYRWSNGTNDNQTTRTLTYFLFPYWLFIQRLKDEMILSSSCIISWLLQLINNWFTAAEPQRTRFFTGNNAIDAGAAGAALGVGAQYFANQIFNPCTRGGTRGGNKGTNNRIFGGQTLQNGALGFLAGFAGAALVNNAQGNPCGR